MKRLLSLLLAILLMLSCTGCGQSKKTVNGFDHDDYEYDDYEYDDDEYDDDDDEYDDDDDEYEYDGDTVYVSKSGKIHSNPDCSGMIYYKEMDYDEAIDRGYDLCQNCY